MLDTIMRLWVSAAAWALCAALSALATAPRPALAAPKNKPYAAATRKPNPKNSKRSAAPAAPAAPRSNDSESDAAASADESEPDRGAPSGVKAASPSGAQAAAPSDAAAQATVQEDKAGVKTYKFGTVEVEGRMKSPQIIYFLRRVRAEFDAGALGHRSFMRELADTRNNSALR